MDQVLSSPQALPTNQWIAMLTKVKVTTLLLTFQSLWVTEHFQVHFFNRFAVANLCRLYWTLTIMWDFRRDPRTHSHPPGPFASYRAARDYTKNRKLNHGVIHGGVVTVIWLAAAASAPTLGITLINLWGITHRYWFYRMAWCNTRCVTYSKISILFRFSLVDIRP